MKKNRRDDLIESIREAGAYLRGEPRPGSRVRTYTRVTGKPVLVADVVHSGKGNIAAPLVVRAKRKRASAEKRIPFPPPGDIIKEDFLADYGLTVARLARLLAIPENRLKAVINGRSAITANVAARLALCYGTSVEFWLNLQREYDLRSIDWKTVKREVKPVRTGAQRR
jgi:antitoxin HigA-1